MCPTEKIGVLEIVDYWSPGLCPGVVMIENVRPGVKSSSKHKVERIAKL
jgi:hypothetical protein